MSETKKKRNTKANQLWNPFKNSPYIALHSSWNNLKFNRFHKNIPITSFLDRLAALYVKLYQRHKQIIKEYNDTYDQWEKNLPNTLIFAQGQSGDLLEYKLERESLYRGATHSYSSMQTQTVDPIMSDLIMAAPNGEIICLQPANNRLAIEIFKKLHQLEKRSSKNWNQISQIRNAILEVIHSLLEKKYDENPPNAFTGYEYLEQIDIGHGVIFLVNLECRSHYAKRTVIGDNISSNWCKSNCKDLIPSSSRGVLQDIGNPFHGQIKIK